MIDIHCHVLPGMDDGPEFLDKAIDMCRAAEADGVKCIVATPHYKPGTYEFSGSRIVEAVDTLMAAVQNRGLDIRVLPGAEVTVSPEMSANVKAGGYLTLNQGRYFLAEFSPLSVPAGWDAFLLSFIHAGLSPIIAHPERNAWFVHHPDALAAAVQCGVKLQITAMSLAGGFGARARDFSLHLLRQNLVHVIASDSHSADYRPPRLAEAVCIAADVVGRQRAEALVNANPCAIIEGRPIPAMEQPEYPPPVKAQNRNWFKRLRDFSFASTS
jgi:protein-tyrosine phosphatase